MTKRTIWLADDDDDDRVLFSDIVSESAEDVRLIFVSDGVALLERLRSNEPLPDLLILDIDMPFKSGMQCLKEIKEDAHLATVPVVIWSTVATNQMIQDAYRLGARLFVRKPYSYGALKSGIKHMLLLDVMKNEPFHRFYVDVW